MFDGKLKAVTFSYDDGVTQDEKLISILDKYGLKCTFNLNSGTLGRPDILKLNGKEVDHHKVSANDVARIYREHEVASHTVSHPSLNRLRNGRVMREIERDREALSRLVGYEVRGFAYPGGTEVSMSDRTVDVIRNYTGVQYARTTDSTYSFEPQFDLLRFNPTVHHVEWEKLFGLCESFLSLNADSPKIFYIWGHSYEFDVCDDWSLFEDFCAMISGRDDVFYGTNSEVLLDPDLMNYSGATLHTYTRRRFLF